MASSSASKPGSIWGPSARRVEELPDEDPRLIFKCPADTSAYRGAWQDRPMGPSPLEGIRFSYYNNSKTTYNSNILQVILREHGFARVELPDDDWNIFWCAGQVNPAGLKYMKPHQRVNKFPKASALTLKANLWTNYARMQRLFGEEAFNFMPTTFLIPSQLEQLEAFIHASGHDGTDPTKVWIVKPAAAYCGRGITLHRSSPEMPEALLGQKGVASKYVDPPFLLDGLKSDIRIYVLVSSWHPLTVYQYCDGLARFATEKYTLDDIDGRCAHLTNYSLNKHSASFVNDDSEESGSKWSLAAFKRRLVLEIGEAKATEVWRQVDDLIVKIMVAVEPNMMEGIRQHIPAVAAGAPNKQCFQIFGFDVMLDAHAKPWLLEVNLDPALKTDSPLDLRIKSNMLVDLLNVVAVPIPPAQEEESEAWAGTRGGEPPGVSATSSQGGVVAGVDVPGAMGANEIAVSSHHSNKHDGLTGSGDNADGCDAVGRGGQADEGAGEAKVTESPEMVAQREAAILKHTNAEFRRSKLGGWRRLFPSNRTAEYLPFLDPSRKMHALPFDL